jgi:hypothetical protein
MRRTTRQESIHLLGWPTETVSIQWIAAKDPPPNSSSRNCTDTTHSITIQKPHTTIFFIPGNPGLVQWYIPILADIIDRLGPGYCAFGASHAGHAIGHDTRIHANVASAAQDTTDDYNTRSLPIPWNVEGQVLHKIAFVDYVLSLHESSFNADEVSIIFLSHSIGCYFCQQLCLLRPDILQKTRLFLHLLPFICMKAPVIQQTMFNMIAKNPLCSIALLRLAMQGLACLSESTVNLILKFVTSMDDIEARDIAVKLARQPDFAKHFLELGCREIRQVPNYLEVSKIHIAFVQRLSHNIH